MKIETRKSGIELAKIIAMLLIVISHVVLSVSNESLSLNETLDFINLNAATTNINNIVLIIFRYLGAIGNDIFLISSIWFLCESKKTKLNKIINIVLDVWFISFLFFLYYKNMRYEITAIETLRYLLPTFYATNWYVTCYILLYAIHPLLNIVIDNINKKQHYILCAVTMIIYCGLCLLSQQLYINSLLIFIVIYFFIAYIKKYCLENYENNNKKILLVSTLLLICLIVVTNIAGLNIQFLANEMQKWNSINNPLIILISLSVFIIFKNIDFESKLINYISSLSLYIYLIHENELFVKHNRSELVFTIKNMLSMPITAPTMLIISILLFVVVLLLSLVYKETIGRITEKISNSLSK